MGLASADATVTVARAAPLHVAPWAGSQCATVVAAEQGNINRSIREADTALADITAKMVDRQKKYEKHAEKLAGVREVSRTLAKCHMLLNENIDMMDALNNSLPSDLRLEPFVWTTG